MNLEDIVSATNLEDERDWPVGKALVVLSGGQDSVTCLLWAVRAFPDGVAAVTFNYGQKHATEINCARSVCNSLGMDHYIVDMSYIGQVSESALLASNGGDVRNQHALNPDLPASFVPNRNAMMLAAAHALAQSKGFKHLVAGMCQTDYSGYPDCRADFITALEHALNLGAAKRVTIHTPLMYLSKADTFELASRLNGLGFVVENSHTCYNGVRNHRHAWGYGCGECPACRLRAKGYNEFTTRGAA